MKAKSIELEERLKKDAIFQKELGKIRGLTMENIETASQAYLKRCCGYRVVKLKVSEKHTTPNGTVKKTEVPGKLFYCEECGILRQSETMRISCEPGAY